MASSYPGAIDSFTTKSAGQTITAAHVNDMQDAVVAVQTELGTDPAGSEVDVKTRLDNLIPVSMLRLDTHAGYGSTNTRIQYFSNVRTDVDTSNSWTYANTSTNGLSVTIDIAGTYAISYSPGADSAHYGGISLNSNSLTTNINDIDVEDRLASNYHNIGGGTTGFVGWSGRLAVNDVIRPHTNAVVPGSTSAAVFSIVRLT